MPGPQTVVDPAAARRGAEAARKATGIGPAPPKNWKQWFLDTVLETATGMPPAGEEVGPFTVLGAIPGFGAAGKALKGATKLDEAADAAVQGIRAYHGSPHDFDRFDLSKIGTGEGAQAYGHGLYFAENPKTANDYRRALSKPMETEIGGYRVPDWAADQLRRGFQSQSVLAGARSRGFGPDDMQELEAALKAFSGGAPLKLPGHTYEVNINADPASLLDWDAPLTRQSPQVQEALKKLGMTPRQLNNLRYTHAREPSGGDMYRSLGRARSGGTHGTEYPDEATAALREAGVPGIQYWDQGSRLAGAGTRNYTIGDDSLISILRKYGLLAGAGAGAATQRDALLQQLQGDGAQ